MNIIKQIFETPDTPSGKKRLNNLITRLGLGKKIKGDLMKDVVSGELGGANNSEVKKYKYYRINNLKDEDTMTNMQLIALFTDVYVIVRAYLHSDTEFLARIVLGWSIHDIIKININGTINYPNGSDNRFYPITNQPIEYILNIACEQGMLTEITKEEYYSYDFIKYEDIEYENA